MLSRPPCVADISMKDKSLYNTDDRQCTKSPSGSYWETFHRKQQVFSMLLLPHTYSLLYFFKRDRFHHQRYQYGTMVDEKCIDSCSK